MSQATCCLEIQVDWVYFVMCIVISVTDNILDIGDLLLCFPDDKMSYIAFVSLSSSMKLSSPYARNGFLVFYMHFPCIPITVLQLSMTGVCVCECVCV